MKLSGLNPLTWPAILQEYSDVSNRSINEIPLCAFTNESQVSFTLLPHGFIVPIPVITTRRLE